jgi:hypothetical protein
MYTEIFINIFNLCIHENEMFVYKLSLNVIMLSKKIEL